MKPPTEERCRVRFLPADRTIEIKSGETLLQAARQAGVHVNASCGGAGLCGKCRVQVAGGAVAGGEGKHLSQADLDEGFRQACTARVTGEATIRVPQASRLLPGGLVPVPARHFARLHRFEIESLREEGLFAPPVEKLFVELPRPSPLDNMADAGRLILGLNNQYEEHGLVLSLPVLRKLRQVMRQDDFRVTVTLSRPVVRKNGSSVVNVQPGNWVDRSFGLAFDIGTTTVQGQLVDLHSGRVLAEAGDYNGQLGFGEDVISRMLYAETAAGQAELQAAVAKTVNGLIGRLLGMAGADKDEITSVTLAGNSVMTHLLLGLEPHNIRRAPYVPVSTFFPPIRATDLQLNLSPHVVAMIYPAISSYVGGDIVAGVMGAGMYRSEALTLYIDIGTNAEIVIGNREWLVCAACSAGPAFEGGGITHGMRAADGAIEDFSLDPASLEPMNITVGNRPALGICGSGLLAIVAALFEHRVIDQRGRFRPDLPTPRVREGRNGREYVLVRAEEAGEGRDIVINEVDIGNFMRAKAAIFAGVKTLVEEVGLAVGDLEQVILAGAFGSYINLDCAMTVGLLPEVDPDKVVYVGNGSLMGARMSELSNHIRRDVMDVVHRMTSFELSEVAGFKDQYVASLFLPHTDRALFPKVHQRLRTG
ncbi:MAG: ASKHA domain-containing protein [Desulfobacteraceae bacterium]|nr:ASKHA domain-containing protein [Desulfobacteraceae bacterium]